MWRKLRRKENKALQISQKTNYCSEPARRKCRRKETIGSGGHLSSPGLVSRRKTPAQYGFHV